MAPASALDLTRFNNDQAPIETVMGGRSVHESSRSKWQSSFGCPLTHSSLRAYLSREKEKELLAALPREELENQYYNEAIKFSFVQGLYDSHEINLHIKQTRKCRQLDDQVKEVMANENCEPEEPRFSRKRVELSGGTGIMHTSTRSGAEHDILSHPEDGDLQLRSPMTSRRYQVSGKITNTQYMRPPIRPDMDTSFDDIMAPSMTQMSWGTPQSSARRNRAKAVHPPVETGQNRCRGRIAAKRSGTSSQPLSAPRSAPATTVSLSKPLSARASSKTSPRDLPASAQTPRVSALELTADPRKADVRSRLLEKHVSTAQHDPAPPHEMLKAPPLRKKRKEIVYMPLVRPIPRLDLLPRYAALASALEAAASPHM